MNSPCHRLESMPSPQRPASITTSAALPSGAQSDADNLTPVASSSQDDQKPLTTLKARAPLAGHTFRLDQEGRVILARWDRSMDFGDIATASAWLAGMELQIVMAVGDRDDTRRKLHAMKEQTLAQHAAKFLSPENTEARHA